ncbi:hypothetical protein OIU78_015499 [Salix suchowensis]|nr:hypothetical protein OIU78_015499 [Salix suchowensis]
MSASESDADDYVGFTKRYIETAYFATSRSELLHDPLLGSRECSHAKYAATFTAERHGATSNGNQDVTIPILVGNISTGCVHDFSPLYYTQSSAAWSPKLSGQQQSPYPLGNSIHSNPDVHDSKKNHRCSDETTCNSADQKNGHQQNNTEPVDQVRHGSAAGQSET